MICATHATQFSSVPPYPVATAQSSLVNRAGGGLVLVDPTMSGDILDVIDTRLLKPYKYPRLAHKSYMYHFHKSCTRHLRWKCNRDYSSKCPAVLRTNMDMLNLVYISVDHEHNHENDAVAIVELKMKLKTLNSSTTFQ